MEFLISIENMFVDKFLNAEIDFYYMLHGTLFLLILLILPFCLSILYTKVRRRFPVRVNCWFCCNNAKVPYELSNSWDCPHCLQYNGFNKNGDYNKVIKEQYNSNLNESIFTKLKNSLATTGNSNEQTNGFCKLCNINQQLKIQQLALFIPVNEANYDEEIEEYRLKLENAYKLCSDCETMVKRTLEKQEYNFLQEKLNNREKKPYGLQKIQFAWKHKWKEVFSILKRKYKAGLKWICLISSILLLFALIIEFETENQFLPLRNFAHIVNLESIEPVLKMVSETLETIHEYRKVISFVGLLCSLIINDGQRKVEEINSIVWGLFNLILWSPVIELQIIVCGISIFLNHRIVERKKLYLLKRSLPKKYSFQPEKKLFSDECRFASDEIIHQSPPDPFDSFKKENKNDFGSFGYSLPEAGEKNVIADEKSIPAERGKNETVKKKSNRGKNEIESLNGEETKMVDSGPGSKATDPIIPRLLEFDKNEEFGPRLDEVHNHLSSLSLGGGGRKQQKKKIGTKRSNFLFDNQNSSAKKISPPPPSPIIKPAKFIKNLSNSWTCQESNESISRSSTPSSGYSSQKPEQNRFELSKAMSPITVNTFPRRDYGEYLDGSNRYYNFNCYPHEFLPFQQCQGPMGHATIYTCARPANFSFPFPANAPMAPYPVPCRHSNSFSPRISEISDSDNLFQNGSKIFEENKKWFKLKRIFYYSSVFLNFLTVLSFAYFFSIGVISVDWNLPRINFFT